MINYDLIETGITLVLEGMGIDIHDPHFADTPRRVAKMYGEMLTPELNNMTMFEGTPFKSMITLRGHEVIALCPHHLMPVRIKAYVSYIPEQKIVGLSKLARAVEEHLTRPITQEELTDAIADTLVKSLRPKGVGVILTGTHGCMQYRGIRTHADVATSAMRGVYLDVAAAREEFLALSVGGRV